MFKKGHLAPCGGSRKAKHVWGPSLSYSKGLKQAGRANWVKTAMRARAGGTCGNLNENNPPCICLNTGSLIGGTVWKILGAVVLLEELCH